jgi:hypothetical protein
MDSREQLEKDGLLWLLVGAIGFFFGFGWLTGPLGWYFGRQLKKRCDAAVVHPAPDVIQAAYIVGIVTTALTVLAVVAVVIIFVFVLGVAGVAATR